MLPMPDSSAQYPVVEKAIRYLQRHARAQPSLAELAHTIGLSEFHLQRLFAQWAGVSPKRFLQYLTKEHAKAALRATSDVLDAALQSGLSGPGRLHDLLVTCEGVSPGEVRALGSNLRIGYAIHPTPFGPALIATTLRGVCRVEFVEPADEQAAIDTLRSQWPFAVVEEDRPGTAHVAQAMFRTRGTPTRLHLMLRGTNFQIQVWEALLRIPAGRVLSYGQVASLVGSPNASRAVGAACAANTIGVLIPCHRVIRENGDPASYRWGIERKRALIAWEAAGVAQRDDPTA